MTYRIARKGQIHGPYSLLQVQRQLASGEIVASDLAQSEAMEEWLPIGDLFPESPMQDELAGAGNFLKLIPDPPDLRWWVALLLGVFTLGAFFVVWDIVEAMWLRRVERKHIALVLYSVALVLFVINLPEQIGSINHALFNGPPVEAPLALTFSLAGLLARLLARFVLRNDLLRHFNDVEPMGLSLNWFWTLLFGGLYFQYHFNRINERKRALRMSVPG